MEIFYQISYHSPNTAAVSVTVPEPCRIRFIYRGMQVLSFSCQSGSPLDEGDILFAEARDCLKFSYICELGFPGKHGHQGWCDLSRGAFELGKVIMQPIAENGASYHCTFCFQFPRPVQTAISELQVASIEQIVHTAKHPLIYGSFRHGDGYFSEFPEETPYVRNLLDFYEALFSVDLSDLRIFLLKKEPQIFGGAGNSAICASFDPNSLRDCELLSHRICHAALSRTPYSFPVYAEEGLASYFELKSMESLSGLNFSLDEALRELYRRYLLFYLGYHVHLIPDQETRYMSQPHLIEFLHYTQMPLITAALDRAGKLHPEALDSPYFHTDRMLRLDFPENEENSTRVLQQLNDFCYLIYTWETYSHPDAHQHRLTAGPPARPPKDKNEEFCRKISPVVFSQITRNSDFSEKSE